MLDMLDLEITVLKTQNAFHLALLTMVLNLLLASPT